MKRLLLALWLFLVVCPAQAALLTADLPRANLLTEVEYLEDPTGALTLDEVRARDAQWRRWSRGGTEMNFGFTSSAYWIRIPLQRAHDAPAQWLLEVHYAKLSHLDLHVPGAAPVLTGMNRPLASRPYFDRNFVFPLTVGTEAQEVYLRVTSRYALTVPLSAWRPDAFRQAQQRFQVMQFLYYGGLVVLALYGAVIYLAIRDRRFLVYAGYIATAGLGIFASNGFGRLLLWPGLPAFDEVAQSAFLSLGAFFAVLFARRLLVRHDESSWLARGMQLCGWVFLFTAALDLLHMAVPVLLRPSNQLLMANSVVMGVLVSIACLRAQRAKLRGVRFFLLGWLLLWLGISVAALRAFGIVPSNAVTSYAVQLATVFEMVLMAMALGDLLVLEHQAHLATKEQALVANRALLELSQASEEQLKQAVRQRTEQLETSLKQERSLREQYVRFGSMISHEFRTPLGIIQTQASLMRKEHGRGIDHVDKRLDAIGSAAQRLKFMFDKWLQGDAISQTLEVLEPRPLALEAWLRTLVATSSHLLLNHAVQLRLHPQVDMVNADEYHLGVALTNLLDNAAKYSQPDSTITVETRLEPGRIGIAVSDNGPGIPLEAQDKVFGEYFRLAPASPVRGVGLGLSIVRRIAQAHGGDVELSSQPGQGATFCLWLPAGTGNEVAA